MSKARLLRDSIEALIGVGSQKARLLRDSIEVLVGTGSRKARSLRESVEVLVGTGSRKARLQRISVEVLRLGGGGGIFKSSDGLQTVAAVRPAAGFPAWPFSAIARQVAVGSPSAVSGDDTLLVVRSPQGAAQSYKRETATLTGGLWVKQETGASTSQDVIENVKKLGDYHYRIISAVGTAPTFSAVVGQLQRSPDGGLNWTNVGPAPKTSGGHDWGVSDITIAADGTLWLCATSQLGNSETDFEPEIYNSGDNGATWDFVWQEAVNKEVGLWLMMWSIACHPANQNIIVISGDGNIGGLTRTWNTQTGGAPFSYYYDSSTGTAARNRYLVVLDNARGCMVLSAKAYVSDDFGATAWVEKEDNLAPGGTWVTDFIRGGKPGHIFVCGYGGAARSVVRSRDYGETWEQIVNATDLPAIPLSLTYDSVKDILYIATADVANERVYALSNASLVSAGDVGAQVMRNLSLNLDVLFDTEFIAPRGLALK